MLFFSRHRQQKGLVLGFLGWQRCWRSFPSESPSQSGRPPPQAADLLRWVHPLSCTSACSPVLPREAAAPKEMPAAAKRGPVSSAVTTFQEPITKTRISCLACHRAGSHCVRGVCRGGDDAASVLALPMWEKPSALGGSPTQQKKKKKKELYCFLLPQNSLPWPRKGGGVMPASQTDVLAPATNFRDDCTLDPCAEKRTFSVAGSPLPHHVSFPAALSQQHAWVWSSPDTLLFFSVLVYYCKAAGEGEGGGGRVRKS